MAETHRLRDAVAGRYQIERELGRGGSATVYLAHDLKQSRPVALKVLDAEIAAAIGAERFRREIEIASGLMHPHVLALHDSGAEAGRLYYVMPYVAGESLRRRIEREGPLPVEDAVRLAREIASALGHAHRHGLVHRDIKPENVLLADGMALVADFGIAHVMGAVGDRGLTPMGSTLGTPEYMAPEQLLNRNEVDGRADLYALGCVLYEMLAGRPPFTGPAETLAHQHLNVEPRPVTEVRPTVPAAVAAVIARALAKLPADRYASAAQFAESLEVAASGHATLDVPPAFASPNNLPRPRTRFIGREQELADGVRRLSDTRLLTLTGIGGCGKTRLALRLAETVVESFADGVWFVDLAPLQDAERVPLALAAAIGVREEAGVPLVETLCRRLCARRSLVILDNCEHVLGAAAALADRLLSACSQIHLLATSREGLAIEGERCVTLRSLSLPAAGLEQDLGAIAASEAVRLFVDRAQLADPRFELNETTAPAVAEICRRVDGIPLALELAAARINVLKAEEIRARLDDRFRLLTSGSRTALPRHQTLRATIRWSHDQLDPKEQRLLRLLSVFAGGWTLGAAVAAAGDRADEFEVLDTLAQLVRKSLVILDRDVAPGSRYSMLETVRQYALERLDEAEEAETARARHAGFFLSLAEQAEPELSGPQQAAWFSRLDQERENLLSAHAWFLRDAARAEAGLRLTFAVRRYWLVRGLLDVGRRVTAESLAAPGAAEPDLPRCRALSALGQLEYFMGRHDEARGHFEESLSIGRALGHAERVADALRQLGYVSHGVGDLAAARAQFEESLSLARDLDDPYRVSAAGSALAEVHRQEGNLDAAEPLYEEALENRRKEGDRDNVAVGLVNLSMLSIARGAGARAREMLREALAIAEELGSKKVGQLVLDVSAGLAGWSGESRLAARFFGAATSQLEQMGLQRERADEAFLMPLLDSARAALGEGPFASAVAEGRRWSYEEATAEARHWLATED